MPSEESSGGDRRKTRTNIDRRDALLKGFAGLGVAAGSALGLSALSGRATAAIQDATYLVQDPSTDLTAEKVVGTDLTLSGWDYIVWTNGTTVFGQNGRTSKVVFCRMNAYLAAGQQGLRFTGKGDIENGLFLHCRIRAQNNGVSLVTFDAPSDANGHIAFYRCQLENVGGFTGVDCIKYTAEVPGVSGPGHTGPVVAFTDCSFVHHGGTPTGCSILRMYGTTAGGGPRSVVLMNPNIQVDQASIDLFQLDQATAFIWFGVVVQNPSLTVGAQGYTWIQNHTPPSPIEFQKGSMLQVRGGHITGSDPTSFAVGMANANTNFKVTIADVVRFNPLGAAAITPLASPYVYTNDDGVGEAILLNGARGSAGTLTVGKDSLIPYSIGNNERFHLAIWLEPREAITITYTSGSGDSLTMTKDRK